MKYKIPFSKALKWAEEHRGVLLTIDGNQRVFCRANGREAGDRKNVRVRRGKIRQKDYVAIRTFFK